MNSHTMFERYDEKARRAIFFARYEALQYGSPEISPEHLLLGVMRADKQIVDRFLPFGYQLSVDSVRNEFENRVAKRTRIPQSRELRLARSSIRVLAVSSRESTQLREAKVGVEHILLGILGDEDLVAAQILAQFDLNLSGIREKIVARDEPLNQGIGKISNNTPNLEEFARDLTREASLGKLDPLIGRTIEAERLIEILCRRTKNNPLLVGEPGVGKTAIVEGLAQRIADGDVPKFLREKRFLMLDLSLIVAGTKYRGQFEERLKNILDEVKQYPNNIIFIDEIHTLVGAGSAEGSLDAANILKPALSRGEIQSIGATTPRDFRKTIEKDRSLERRFQSIKIEPPNEEEALEIVEGIAVRYELFHHIRYTKAALEAAVYLSNRYIPERFLPDKAIDVLDEAGSHAKLEFEKSEGGDPRWNQVVENWKNSIDLEANISDDSSDLELFDESLALIEITKEDVENVIARWTKIPIQSIQGDEIAKLLKLEETLHKKIVSQNGAISSISRAIRRSRAGLKNPTRPIGSFLFLGPTGVGKTEVAKKLAEYLFGSERVLIRFDMTEFSESHSIARLIGSPPGYVGHDEGGQLTEKIRRMPYSVVLFDEIEKAHADLFNVLLQIFDDGILTDALGSTVDCKNVIFIMTSNLGARIIQKQTALGFQANSEGTKREIAGAVIQEVKKTFAPEFVNRLDEIVMFDELTDEDLSKIIDLHLLELNKLVRDRKLRIEMTNGAKQWIIEETCADRSFGARPIKRAIQKYIEDELSEALIRGDFVDQDLITVIRENGSIKLKAKDSKSSRVTTK